MKNFKLARLLIPFSGAITGIAFGWLIASCILPLFTGCATLDPNADPFVVRTEQVQKQADATFDFLLGVDNADRGFWRTNAPAFHNFCEYLRTPIPVSPTHNSPRILAIERNVQDLKVQYKDNRSAGNSNLLYQISSELRLLVLQGNSWSNIVSTPNR